MGLRKEANHYSQHPKIVKFARYKSLQNQKGDGGQILMHLQIDANCWNTLGSEKAETLTISKVYHPRFIFIIICLHSIHMK